MAAWLVRLPLPCLAVGALPFASTAADLTKVKRVIRKEPFYKSKEPRYCLLVFGSKADYRVWLVLDGDTLYVDRNGNGDLTEGDESTGPRAGNTDPCSFQPVTLLTKAEDAPVLHIDGPLQMGFEVPAESALRRSDPLLISLTLHSNESDPAS